MSKEWKYYRDVKGIIKKTESRNSIVFYDLETSGIRKIDTILQFSAIRFSLPDWKETEKIDLYIKCPFSVNGTKASEVNHITDEFLAENGLDREEAFKKIREFIHEDDLIAGYNNESFDNRFMERFYEDFGCEFKYADSLDVYKFAKMVVPPECVMVMGEDKKKKASYKLEILTKYYDPESTIAFHSAIEDVSATAFVYVMASAEAKQRIKEHDEEEEKRKAVPRQDATVLRINLFNPSQRIKRVYVSTDQGTVYYDEITHIWKAKTGSIDSVNMNGILEQVFKKLGISKEGELYNAVVKRDKLERSLAILDMELSELTSNRLEEAYKTILNDTMKESLPENEKEENIKSIKSAYNYVKKYA